MCGGRTPAIGGAMRAGRTLRLRCLGLTAGKTSLRRVPDGDRGGSGLPYGLR